MMAGPGTGKPADTPDKGKAPEHSEAGGKDKEAEPKMSEAEAEQREFADAGADKLAEIDKANK